MELISIMQTIIIWILMKINKRKEIVNATYGGLTSVRRYICFKISMIPIKLNNKGESVAHLCPSVNIIRL